MQKKWRQSIKCNGKELGDWLFDHIGLEAQDTSQNQNESKLSQILRDACSQRTDSACNQVTGGTSELPSVCQATGGKSEHKSVLLATGCTREH